MCAQLQQMQVDIPSGTLENIEQALSLSQNFYELIAKQVNVKYQGNFSMGQSLV